MPDYFGGHHKPVLQAPVDGNTTRKELYAGLLSGLAQGIIDYQIDENQLDYDAIRDAIKECIYFKPECSSDDILFPDLDKWDESDYCDSVYAYFVIDWKESENE